VDGRHLGLTQSAVPSRECRRRGPRDGAGNGVCLAPSKVPPRADPETPRRGDRRCPDPVGRGKGAFASDRRRAGRWRGRRPLSHLESDWQSPKGALPPRDRRVRAEAERRSRATVGVVFGVREAPRSCSELDSIAEAIERRPAVRTWREPGRCGLARSARARRREKAATKVPSPAGSGANTVQKAGLRASPVGPSMGKGTLVRRGPSRWRAGGRVRIRREARRRVTRDRECQRSSSNSARGRQRRGGGVKHRLFGARLDRTEAPRAASTAEGPSPSSPKGA